MTSHQRQKHIKPAQIIAEQYLQDQLQKHTTTDPLEDILKQFEKQPCTSNMHIIKNRPCTNNPAHEGITLSKGMDSKQINKEVNSEQVISDKRVLVNRDSDDKSKDSDGCMKARYGRKIRKPDRLAY